MADEELPTMPSPEVMASMLETYERLALFASPEFRMYTTLHGLPTTESITFPPMANLGPQK